MNQTADKIYSFRLHSINPANGTSIEKHSELTESNLENRLESLAQGFQKWRSIPLSERLEALKSIKSSLRNNESSLADTVTLETGKPIAQSLAEIRKCVDLCDYYINTSHSILEPTTVDTPFEKSYYTLKPLGTVLLIMPWNYPIWQVFRTMVPALALGNVVALKHAGNVQLCAKKIETLLDDAGIPEGIFVNLPIEETLTRQAINHPTIKGVSLTGSVNAGKSVAALAGKRLIKSVMELGGNDPLIVLKDADLQLAAEKTVAARMTNCGQTCISPKRIIVDRSIHDEFTSLLLNEISKYKASDPRHVDCKLGPMARADILHSFQTKLNQARAKGARCLFGGNAIDSNGFWHEPTLFTNLPRDPDMVNDEVFGPALYLYTSKNEADALEFANQGRFGLGASLFTRDLEKAEKLANDSIHAGSVFINSTVKSHPKLPFGGIGESGYGRELGPHGLSEFANVKTIAIK
ncbi:aldehyde dehydrogenase family protein [Puniceicoccaceae bacterium K14]|nr:aldehyde dehydrogenase family protein [Puniceicoccaceae bacterium K14]